ncbi:MAG: glutamate--tRNA ligase [Acidimicrobiia bacterium]|nr:glutamate--tRNA ligase [Acidimicrobiia bacterium]
MLRLRFAPSPTGYLHVGNARTALFNWLMARGSGGTFIVRVEDTDAERSTAESEQSILDDLRWLGLTWDEGPDAGGPHVPYRQSERLDLYRAHATRLLAEGRAYRCFCSPEQLELDRQSALTAGQPVRYVGRCRQIGPADAEHRVASGERAAIRFRVPESRDVLFEDAVRGTVRFSTDVIGDLVIQRSDGTPAYNFAVVIDDAKMAVTHVIRGEDHISNTPRQLLLYEAFGYTPPRFAHLSMVLGPDHTKLSKRHGATSVAEFRAKGYLPEALANYLALVGWSPSGGGRHGGGATREQTAQDHDTELMSLAEMAKRFSIRDVSLSAGVFDEEKLAWVNRHYLREADPARIADLAVDVWNRTGVPMNPDADGRSYLASVMPIATGSVDRLDQFPTRLAFLFEFDPEQALEDPQVSAEMSTAGAMAVARAFAAAAANGPRLDRDRFRALVNEVKGGTGQKGKALFHPIRLLLTARADGPELDLAVPALDRGAELPASAGVPPILGCRERAALFLRVLDARASGSA